MSALQIFNDSALLAPAMETIAREHVAQCRAHGLDFFIAETVRTAARQAWLYASGRTRPGPIVTNAATVWDSWHGFALAYDGCSQKYGWKVDDDYWKGVCEIARPLGLECGYDWHMRDRDHFQFGKCKIRPSILSKQLYATGGLVAVWDACGAL